MSWDDNLYYHDDNLYYHPEKSGLEVFGVVNWGGDLSYEFDMTVVWRNPESGQFFAASDSGCSCPTPFESYHTLADLAGPYTAAEVIAYVKKAGGMSYYAQPEDADNLIERLRAS